MSLARPLTRSGERVRTVVVEFTGREPVAVVRKAFAVIAFNDTRCVDATRLREQFVARGSPRSALQPALGSAFNAGAPIQGPRGAEPGLCARRCRRRRARPGCR